MKMIISGPKWQSRLEIVSYLDSVINHIDLFVERERVNRHFDENWCNQLDKIRSKQIERIEQIRCENLTELDTNVDIFTKSFCFAIERYGLIYLIVTDEYIEPGLIDAYKQVVSRVLTCDVQFDEYIQISSGLLVTKREDEAGGGRIQLHEVKCNEFHRVGVDNNWNLIIETTRQGLLKWALVVFYDVYLHESSLVELNFLFKYAHQIALDLICRDADNKLARLTPVFDKLWPSLNCFKSISLSILDVIGLENMDKLTRLPSQTTSLRVSLACDITNQILQAASGLVHLSNLLIKASKDNTHFIQDSVTFGAHFPTLNNLVLSGFCFQNDRLDSMNMFNHSNLDSLSLQKCGLKSIDADSFSSLVNLTSLDLSYNLLNSDTSWTFLEPLGKLKSLLVCFNKINSLEMLHLPGNLEELNLTGNKITMINRDQFNKLLKLKRVNFSLNFEFGGDLDSLDLGPWCDVTMSHTQVNVCKLLNSQKLTGVRALDLSGNLLDPEEVLDGRLGDNSSIQYLRLSMCGLINIDLSESKFTSLIKLDMSQNDLRHLKKNMFAGLDNLEELNLSWNPITTIDSTGVFRNLGRLKLLNLWGHLIEGDEEKLVNRAKMFDGLYGLLKLNVRHRYGVDNSVKYVLFDCLNKYVLVYDNQVPKSFN